MATTNVTIRLDKEVKKESELIFKYLGINMSTAINMFLRQTIMSDGLPFEVKLRFNEKTREAMEDARLGRNLSGPFNTTEELMEDLNA